MARTSPYSESTFDPGNANTSWHKLLGMVPSGSKVLDVGCSSGKLGAALKQRKSAHVTGLDITAADIKTASKLLDEAFVYDIENGEVNRDKLGGFDVIIFADVLEHMRDPVEVLKKVRALLNPKGRLLFSIPNMAHMFVRLQLLEGSFRYMETGLLDYTHLHFYDGEEVARIFSAAGYDIKEYDCTTFDYPENLLKEKLAKLGLKGNKDFFEIAARKDAIIFEYIGWAAPVSPAKAAKNQIPPGTSSPLNEVLSYVQRIKDANGSEQKLLKKKIRLSDNHIKTLEKMNEDLRRQNHMLRHPVRAVGKKILKRRAPGA